MSVELSNDEVKEIISILDGISIAFKDTVLDAKVKPMLDQLNEKLMNIKLKGDFPPELYGYKVTFYEFTEDAIPITRKIFTFSKEQTNEEVEATLRKTYRNADIINIERIK